MGSWLGQLLGQGERLALLWGRPPTSQPSVGRIVCACFNASVNHLANAVASFCRRVEATSVWLSAGTNCGSCRPEISRIIDAICVQAAE